MAKKRNDEEYANDLREMDEFRSKISIKDTRHIDNMLKKVTLSKVQHEMIQTFRDNNILFVFGPAGTAKTFTSCYCALDSLSTNQNTNKIILVKPTVPVGLSLGALPGTEKEKTDPFMQSYYDNLKKLVGKACLTSMMDETKTIMVEILQYMRGRTFDDCTLLLDEAQNCNYKEIMLAITRLGKNSKMIIFGDTSQYDVREKDRHIKEFFELFKDIKGVGIFQFENKDIVRSKILVEITKKYEKWRKEKNLD